MKQRQIKYSQVHKHLDRDAILPQNTTTVDLKLKYCIVYRDRAGTVQYLRKARIILANYTSKTLEKLC